MHGVSDLMITETDYTNLMKRGWGGGMEEGTPCGKGSTLAHTESIRARLPSLVKEYSIQSVCDAGAGDLHWMNTMQWDVDYRAFDLMPRLPSVKRADIRVDALPACDLILCRLVLGHMIPNWVLSTLALFRKSGRYLLATYHPDEVNDVSRAGSFNHWNLALEPFSLGEPIERIPDCNNNKRFLGLWRLQ